MKNIVEKKDLQNHTIARYRFKVLGSSVIDEESEQEIDTDISHEEEVEVANQPQIINESQNQFVEELLKKSDTLSSNIIKLQMQIEKQESEFETRLKDSVAREKEISFDEGYAKAKEQLEVKFEEKVSLYLESARKLNEKIKEIDIFFDKLEKDLIETSLEVAKEVIKKEISTSSQKVAVSLAQDLIKDLADANRITIKVNPKDFEELKTVFEENEKVKIESDTAVSLGGVVLLSEKGNLDGNITARLEKVKYLLQSKHDK